MVSNDCKEKCRDKELELVPNRHVGKDIICGTFFIAKDTGEDMYASLSDDQMKYYYQMAVIHCPEAGFSITADGEFTVVPSLKLPKGFIKGSCGAGDAFCAGCLCGIYNNLSPKEILEFASIAAACNLTESDAISGMQSKEVIFKMQEQMERLELDYRL